MRTTATLLLLTALGCGGAGDNTPDTTQPVTHSSEPTETTSVETAEAAPAEAPPTPAEPAAGEAAAAPTPAAASAGQVARAEIKMLTGDTSVGTMTFEQKGTAIAISGQFSGLKKGAHALYIHEKGDCSDKGRKVGGHLNPTKAKHGPPASPQRHAGDFGDLTFDKDGNATFAMETDSITLEQGRADSVVGRAVVIYSKKDSKSGKAGSPMACGVIQLEGASPASQTTPAPAATPAAAK